MNPRTFCLSSLSALALMGMASAACAQSVKIEDAVARVVVIPENRSDVGVEIVPGKSSLPSLQVRRVGNRVEIDGQLGARRYGLGRNTSNMRCSSGNSEASQPGMGAEVNVSGHGRIALEDAPLIVLRTPRDVKVAASSGVFGSVGPGASSLDLATGGCGRWTLANVADKVEIAIGGSGGVRMGSAGSLSISIGGSGNVTAREARALKVAIGGSGDVQLGRLDGPAEISIGGSGDVDIAGGRAERMDISVAGSGDVKFDGRAGDVSVAVVGSGDVYIREATGSVSRSAIGRSSIRIGN